MLAPAIAEGLLPRRHEAVPEIDWRARRPLFDHEQILVTAALAANRIDFATGFPGTAPRITGAATLSAP